MGLSAGLAEFASPAVAHRLPCEVPAWHQLSESFNRRLYSADCARDWWNIASLWPAGSGCLSEIAGTGENPFLPWVHAGPACSLSVWLRLHTVPIERGGCSPVIGAGISFSTLSTDLGFAINP